jgi:ribosomal protein L40E
MRAAQCSFCQHTNPPDAKFCNTCGGALDLAPCPHCGAVNDATASTCRQCSGSLHGRANGAASPSPGVRKSTAAGSAGAAGGPPNPIPPEPLSSEGPDKDARVSATLRQMREYLERSDAEPAVGLQRRPDPPVPQQTRGAGAGGSAAPRPYPVSTVTESWVLQAEPRNTHRGRSAAIAGSAALVILAASGYYVYRWVADSLPVADKAGEGGSRVATGTVAEPVAKPDVGAPTESTPSALATPAIAAPPPTSGVPAVRPGTVVPGDARGPTTAAVAGSARSNTPPQRRGGADAKESSPAAPTAVERPRTIEAGAAFELKRPRVGPCTEAVAALGLCTREPAQGRE